jgi:hypothetical protein
MALNETKNKKARKKHICYECNAIINAGEEYEYSKWFSDSSFYEERRCLPCSELMRDLWDEMDSVDVENQYYRNQLHEYCRGYITPEQELSDPRILAFQIRFARSRISQGYEKLKEPDGGSRRAFFTAVRVAKEMTDLVERLTERNKP